MRRHPIYVAIAGLLLACGGGGTDSGGGITTPPPEAKIVTTVTVSLPSSVIELGDAVQATASVLDQNGAALTGKTVTWTSDNDLIATVTSSGSVTAKAVGAFNITGTVEGKSGKASATAVTSSKWVVDATVLTNADYGGAAGSLADVAVVQLTDGRYRMWMGGIPGTQTGIFSAISTDGVHFVPEAGIRVPNPLILSSGVPVRPSHPFVMRLDDGRLRMYVHNAPGPNIPPSVFSLVSADEGVTWTLEAGTRFSDATTSSINNGGVVKMKSGGWRMYYSTANPTVVSSTGFITPGTDSIKSAFSSDLITWTVDSGIRVGGGAALSGSGVHPGAIANDDGSITIIYFRANGTTGTYTATSTDGLSFTTEKFTGFSGTTVAFDPFLMRLSSGDVRMFYNYGDDKGGKILVAHRRGFSIATP